MTPNSKPYMSFEKFFWRWLLLVLAYNYGATFAVWTDRPTVNPMYWWGLAAWIAFLICGAAFFLGRKYK